MKRKKFDFTDLNHLDATHFSPFAAHTLGTTVVGELSLQNTINHS